MPSKAAKDQKSGSHKKKPKLNLQKPNYCHPNQQKIKQVAVIKKKTQVNLQKINKKSCRYVIHQERERERERRTTHKGKAGNF